jgi:hypothetical protein
MSLMGLMPTAGRVVCNHIVWVRFPQCPQKNALKNEVQVQSGVRVPQKKVKKSFGGLK